jgi:hypothetical protein
MDHPRLRRNLCQDLMGWDSLKHWLLLIDEGLNDFIHHFLSSSDIWSGKGWRPWFLTFSPKIIRGREREKILIFQELLFCTFLMFYIIWLYMCVILYKLYLYIGEILRKIFLCNLFLYHIIKIFVFHVFFVKQVIVTL